MVGVAMTDHKHRPFTLDVDGQSTHVLGDPAMGEETKAALINMARAAIKMFTPPLCPHCGADRVARRRVVRDNALKVTGIEWGCERCGREWVG